MYVCIYVTPTDSKLALARLLSVYVRKYMYVGMYVFMYVATHIILKIKKYRTLVYNLCSMYNNNLIVYFFFLSSNRSSIANHSKLPELRQYNTSPSGGSLRRIVLSARSCEGQPVHVDSSANSLYSTHKVIDYSPAEEEAPDSSIDIEK